MVSTSDRAKSILRGGFDIHAHTGPGLFPRIADSFEAAQQAASYGMRGIVLKNHHSMSSDRATLVGKIVPEIGVYGGVVLNRYVGGINPHAAEAAVRLGGKIVWMPTQWAQHHLDAYGAPEYHHMKHAAKATGQALPVTGVTVLDERGELTEEARQVLGVIASADVALGTGHLAKKEIQILVRAAKAAGVQRIVINHITLNELWDWSIEEQKALIRDGALIEHVAIFCMKNRFLIEPRKAAELIDGVGCENVVIASDCGQMKNPPPADAMHLFLSQLLDVGMAPKALETMVRTNPARVLGLE